MALSKPFQGKAWYWIESSYSGGSVGTKYQISDAILDAKIDTGQINKSLRSITDSRVTDFISTPSDFSFHIEWVEQANTGSLATLCIVRSSSCTLKSLAFAISANTGTGNTPTTVLLKGAIAKNWNIKGTANVDNEYICSADFSCASLKTYAAAWTPPAEINGVYAQFIKAGSIFKNSTTPLAFITNSVDITVNNNLKDSWTCGFPWKKASIPGALDITGSCDISMDDGGKTQIDAVLARTILTNIIVDTNTGGTYDKITLSNVVFDNTTLDVNISGDTIITSQPFTAKSITIGA